MPDRLDSDDDYVLGWTLADAEPEGIADGLSRPAATAYVDDWLETRRSLPAAIRSKVLLEVDVILLKPLHPAAAHVRPLVTRPFSFIDCLHQPPILGRFHGDG